LLFRQVFVIINMKVGDIMKPNLLFIFADQHRRSDIGCYGNNEVITPNLDKFAESGLRFTNCCSNSPVCVPARGSLLTGLFAQKHGAFTNDIAINYDVTSIADVLNDAGYNTGYIGKWHLCGIPRNQYIDESRRLGFKTWKTANCNHDYLNCYYDDEANVRHTVDGYEPEIFGALADEFLQAQSNDKPWALYLSFATPHNPHMRIPDEYLKIYDDVDVTLSVNEIKGYYGHITAIDKQFGILIDTLKQKGQLDNTIIVYTADHGDMLGNHGLTDKQRPYNESVGVPLLISWNDFTSVGVNNEVIGLTDLPVSILNLLGLNFPNTTDGKDLSELFTDPNAVGLESCYIYDLYPCHNAYVKGYEAWRGIVTKNYTYAVTADSEWLLFDNKTDPLQMNNLINDTKYAEIKQYLSYILHEHITKNDALVDGDGYIRMSGKIEEFNRSQIHFNYPIVEELP
jgi:Arylsulfatase A and related enzymes